MTTPTDDVEVCHRVRERLLRAPVIGPAPVVSAIEAEAMLREVVRLHNRVLELSAALAQHPSRHTS